ncbi:hypothetical protein AB4427_04305 [Vibrio artabrorum]|uniref:hypothetical protein n=1 Tax=Vibrio artabrorum TaxID=446374 RepID=UPI00354E3C12
MKTILSALTDIKRLLFRHTHAQDNELKPPPRSFGCQVCDNCDPRLFKHYGYLVADTSLCSQCHEKGECIDIELIDYYRKFGINDDTIYRALPRTRWDKKNEFNTPTYQSLEEIKKDHHAVFEESSRGNLLKRLPL